MRKKMAAPIILISFLITLSIIIISQIPELQPQREMYPRPIWNIDSPRNETTIHTNSVNLTFTVQTKYGYYHNYYYSMDAPVSLDDLSDKVPLNATLISKEPINPWWPWDKHDSKYTCQANIQLQNLTAGQHTITLYYSYVDPILTFWNHVAPSATITFSVDLTTPSPTPISEFPAALALTCLITMGLAVAVVFRRKTF